MSDTLLDVEVLVCSLLRSVLGVLGHCARSLLRLQHHYLGLTMTSRVMGTRNGSLNMSLGDNKISGHGLDQKLKHHLLREGAEQENGAHTCAICPRG